MTQPGPEGWCRSGAWALSLSQRLGPLISKRSGAGPAPSAVCTGSAKKKAPPERGEVWRLVTGVASRVRLQEAPLSLAKLTTRLTNRTLHHLASLDQTEEGPV